ncbi:MAG: hypothetical protein D5R96_00400 [Methanocalculus sp. MSAO_Arc2]|nr:MAG: hypothetical protein D5R96_00400 [Methanocalculus sp. MSAO_Arc2]
MNGTYVQDIIRVVAEITRRSREDDGMSFISASGISNDSFFRIEPAPDRPIAAVDGSNATVYSAPFFSIAVYRGVITWYRNQEREALRATPWRVFRIGEGQDEDYSEIYHEFFGREPDIPLAAGDTTASEAAFRDTIEYGLALVAARESVSGTLLLLDGALYAEHPSHKDILDEIIRTCQKRGLLLAAVTKNASATWDGIRPLVPAAMKAGVLLGAPPPWRIRVPEGHVACLHQKSNRAFLVSVPEDYGEDDISAVFSALASYAGDGRIIGYPYPLVDAHRHAAIRSAQVQRIRHDIIAGCSTQSIRSFEYEEILGDYHDELNRY